MNHVISDELIAEGRGGYYSTRGGSNSRIPQLNPQAPREMWKNWNQLDPGSRLFINGLDFSDRPWWGPIYGSPFEFPFPGRGRNGMMLRPSIHTGGLPGSSLGRRPGPCGPSSGHSGQRGFT
jgi:hypothetical protein